ncbi:hypothetical protein M413DRAFT_423911 [Hebeloma cylindrosporum]|uniref:Uncharacterized protein n=1 Tax=Hebeloma cylindrosporum TaxID=76867 RepID=A0A0C2Y7S2_HEBCY|nr:hypothetical protein M413DRAFT_423911 [Hebeloma cylindrosporum h7]
MTETYELCTRDSRILLHHQLATTDFAGTFNPKPYRQFDHTGNRVWSDLMSGDWAWDEANVIAQDECTHGSMLVPIIAGSDKTTVSVATGHQEYHPLYQQMYHMCIARVFAPLQSGMTVPEVVRCPDGHYRRAVYSLGPYIADYPEQVWLAGIVQGWCPKCEASPDDLDGNFEETRRRRHERTDFIIKCFDPGTVWDKYGIRSDIVPFTHGFPRADIHVLLSPDLLHQLIKGTFKDHLVTWVNEYLHVKYGESRALEIIHDIDRRFPTSISAVPSYAGLRRFSEGRDFAQWTGDDSKALMKVRLRFIQHTSYNNNVYIAAIAGHVPSTMVQCISTFMDLCYIFRRNAITANALATAEALLKQFHNLRHIFITEGIRDSISLPRQHSLLHYIRSIILFGSPNGLCSSITESKHIKAVKEPWRRSSRFRALIQMLRTIIRLEKLAALRRRFLREGLLSGSTAAYFGSNQGKESEFEEKGKASGNEDGGSDIDVDAAEKHNGVEERLGDAGPDSGPRSLSSITLAAAPERRYPKDLHKLAQYINEPDFPTEFKSFLYSMRHPNRPVPDDVENRVNFSGKVFVFHSAMTRFYAPSDLCGPCGMYRQRIRCNPSWYGHPRHDTVFVVEDEDRPGMEGMLIARLHLLFSFTDYEADEGGELMQCVLVSWFLPASDQRDPDTGMWTIKPEGTQRRRPVQVIPLKSIARGAHLLPKYGVGMLPDYITYINALDEFHTYFVNPYIDHHCHEFLSE